MFEYSYSAIINHSQLVFYRNLLKTEEKVETVKKDIVKNRENLEKLEKALAKLDEDATGVLDAYKQAQVL